MKFIKIMIACILMFILVLLTSLGIWFFQGGDLRELIQGCYVVSGSTK